MDKLSPHIRYLFYVLQHKWFVFVECCKLGMPVAGLMHDVSKFLPREWIGYVQKFFWSDEQRGVTPHGITPEDRFTIAWHHHQNSNPHHWEYWLHNKGNLRYPIPMPKKYLKEMLADWRAMSRKFKNDPAEWYEQNKGKIQLRDKDRRWIEEQING